MQCYAEQCGGAEPELGAFYEVASQGARPFDRPARRPRTRARRLPSAIGAREWRSARCTAAALLVTRACAGAISRVRPVLAHRLGMHGRVSYDPRHACEHAGTACGHEGRENGLRPLVRTPVGAEPRARTESRLIRPMRELEPSGLLLRPRTRRVASPACLPRGDSDFGRLSYPCHSLPL